MSSYRARRFAITGLVLAILLGGCAAGPRAPTTTATSQPGPSPGERAVDAALRQVGTPYRYGGASASGFDCSGLVHYAYGLAGVRTPRTTAALWRELEPVSEGDFRIGDVLFFDIAGKVSHVGLYVGGNRFVHAPSSGKSVGVASLAEGYYRYALVRGGRP